MKKILSYLLCVALLVLCVPAGAVSLGVSAETVSGTCGADGGNLTWEYDTETSTLTIAGTGRMCAYGRPVNSRTVAPWRDYCDTAKVLTVRDGVTFIGEYAFVGCTGLESVHLPQSLTAVGRSAFDGCTALTAVYITDLAAWCEIGFANCLSNPLYLAHDLYLNGVQVTDLVIPDGVTTVGSSAFYGCVALTGITVPKSVAEICDSAFFGCTGLESIAVDCENTVYCSKGNCLIEIASKTLILGCKSSVIPTDGSVSVIGDCAFHSCNGLTDIFIPGSVITMGEYAFAYCENLATVTLQSGIVTIGDSAFEDCKSLTSVAIPGSVVTVGEYAFYNCTKLVTATLGGKLAELGCYAFGNCGKLANIALPNGIETVAEGSFYKCTALTGVIIGTAISEIEENAFYGCTKLTAVRITDLAAWCKIDFANAAANPVNYAGCLYLNGTLLTELTVPDGITEIKDYAFISCGKLTDVILPNSVVAIGKSAFERCIALKSIAVKSNVKTIGDAAFKNCYALKSISLPAAVTAIGDAAFYGCMGLTAANLPAGVSVLGKAVFQYCVKLTAVALPDGMTTIGDAAFYGCSGLTAISIPKGVSAIGEEAFYGCSGLKSIAVDAGNTAYCGTGNCLIETASQTLLLGCENSVIPDDGSITVIGENAFKDCKNLLTISIPSGVTVIEASAFSGCAGLTGVVLPQSVTTIGSSAFSGCSGLGEVNVPNGVTVLENHVFSKCTGLKNVFIGSGIITIKQAAFFGCSSLQTVHYIGTETAWNGITVYLDNAYLVTAARHYMTVYSDTAAACTTAGTKVYTCSACDVVHTVTTAASAHDFVGGVCQKCGAAKVGGSATLSGAVSAYGDAANPVTVTLIKNGYTVPLCSVAVTEADYTLSDLVPGTYTLRVSKTKHCTRDYTVVISTKNAVQDVEIRLYGDISGDGKINITDATQAARQFSNLPNLISKAAEDEQAYLKKVADITGDGKINITDVTQIKRKFSNLPSLFDKLS